MSKSKNNNCGWIISNYGPNYQMYQISLKLFILELLVEYILDSCSINHMVKGIVLNNHTQKLFLAKLCLYLQQSTSICVGTVLEKVEDASLTKFCSFCATILPLKFDLYFLCLQTDIYKSFHEISSIAILFENKQSVLRVSQQIYKVLKQSF